MTKHSNTIVAALLATLLLAGLSACTRGQKTPEYYGAQEIQPLEIPENLSRPDHSQALIIDAPYMPPPSLVMETRPPRISSTTSGIDQNSRLNWSAQGLYLLVEDTPSLARLYQQYLDGEDADVTAVGTGLRD